MKNMAIYALALSISALAAIVVGYLVNISLTVLALYIIGYDSGILETVLEFIDATVITAQMGFFIWSASPIKNFLNNHLRGTTK